MPQRILSGRGVATVLKTSLVLLGLLIAQTVPAAINFWSAGGGASTNWSTTANWTAGALANGDTVIFTNAGLSASSTAISNVVDTSYSISSLRFSQTNSAAFQNTLIGPGVTLAITNNNGPSSSVLFVGSTNAADAISSPNTVTISGSGGATLLVSNISANILVGQGSTNSGATQRVTLNLSGLDYFTAVVGRIGVAGKQTFPAGVIDATAGTMYLAKTNLISVMSVPSVYSTNAIVSYPLVVGDTANAAKSGFNTLYLGITNTIFVDGMAFGTYKSGSSGASGGSMLFNPAFLVNNPVAVFRGVGGLSSRVTKWSIGDQNGQGGSNQDAGTNDFTGGTIDILVNTLTLGTDMTEGSSQIQRGVLNFTAGTINANQIIAGNQSAVTAGAGQGPCQGTINITAAAATLVVNSNIELGHTTLPASTVGLVTNSFGALYISNGVANLNNLTVGAVSVTNSIRMVGGTMIVSNTLATNSAGLFALAMTNSTLGLSIPGNGSLRALVRNLTAGGATNVVQLNPTPVFFGSYPQQFPLIKYTAWTGVNNFGLTNLPTWAVGATLVSNSANASLDILLPSDPRPVFTAQPSPYSGNPGDNVTSSFTVTIAAASVTPLSYQWYYISGVVTNLLANGTGPSGSSTLSGATSANLQIANAQPGDNGNYFCVVANVYGTNSSSLALLTISASAIAPTITGPSTRTATNGITATIVNSVSGSPVPVTFWQYNGAPLTDGTGPSGSSTISGSSTATLTISNPQYPGDQGTYSLIASNSAGMATNNIVLTVIVPPSITSQPTSLVVTNTQAASFTVVAAGVPTPTYQWNKNGVPISTGVNPTATSATLNIASAAVSDMASYTVTISNAAGTTNSAAVTLTVNSTMSAVTLSPNNGATGICYDTPLAITFSTAPSLGTAGTIKIYNVTNSATPVDSISVTNGVQARTFPGDGQAFAYQTIQISGNTAKISPHFGVMSSNATYYVTIDNGAFTDATGAYFAGITATNVWQFSTKVGGSADPTNPVVNADGSADFVTVQGAINSLATGTNATQRVVNIRNGLYNEIVDITGKHNVTLRGQSRAGAIISFPNNLTFQNPVNSGTTHARMNFKVNANDIVLDTLTVSNSTPQGGSQAEALMIESSAKRCIVYNSELDSRQDTILGNQNSSQTYFYQSIIKGNFDYIWGGGNFYFDKCTMQTIAGTGSGQLTAARTDTAASTSANFPWLNPFGSYTANGMSFVNCSFRADPGIANITLAGSNGTSNNLVSWFGCDFATNYVAPSATLFNGSYLFWQSANTMTNAPVTFAVLTAISGSDPRLLAATNVPTWFYGWSPQLAPNILTNPVSQTVNYAASATFSVAATGIPDPTYQWQHAGTNLPSGTSASLTIGSATLNDAGSYAVIVTTPAGSATSTTATLTVNAPLNTAPTFVNSFSTFSINVGTTIPLNCSATDSDLPPQTLTYSLLAAPSGATLDGSGNFSWRPTVAQQSSSNPVKVVVTDNGTPNLSATNSFTINVNPLTQPTVDSASSAGGQFMLSVNGQVGPDYTVQVSASLTGGWSTLYTTNPVAMPFTFTDPNGSLPMQFYRILVGP